MAQRSASRPVETPKAGLRQAQAAETEAALKQAALVVFARVGYLNTKIVDITREAGRSAGSFYTYFPGKEALLEALLTDLLAEADVATTEPAHSADFSSRAAVRGHVAVYWEFARRNQVVMTALRQAAIVEDGFAQRLEELGRADLEHLADHLRLAQRQGVRLPGDPYLVAVAIAALFNQFAEQWLNRTDDPTDDETLIEMLTSFVAGGIGLRD